MTISRAIAAVLLLTISGAGAAQKVYKSIDADGNVIYSASPPADVAPDRVEPVRIDPPPAESEQQAARQRVESALGGSGSSAQSDADRRKQTADSDAETANGSAVDAEARFLERNRSNSRVSRGAGVGGGSESGRTPGQLPASRSSR